jgi:hypothetical protein
MDCVWKGLWRALQNVWPPGCVLIWPPDVHPSCLSRGALSSQQTIVRDWLGWLCVCLHAFSRMHPSAHALHYFALAQSIRLLKEMKLICAQEKSLRFKLQCAGLCARGFILPAWLQFNFWCICHQWMSQKESQMGLKCLKIQTSRMKQQWLTTKSANACIASTLATCLRLRVHVVLQQCLAYGITPRCANVSNCRWVHALLVSNNAPLTCVVAQARMTKSTCSCGCQWPNWKPWFEKSKSQLNRLCQQWKFNNHRKTDGKKEIKEGRKI